MEHKNPEVINEMLAAIDGMIPNCFFLAHKFNGVYNSRAIDGIEERWQFEDLETATNGAIEFFKESLIGLIAENPEQKRAHYYVLLTTKKEDSSRQVQQMAEIVFDSSGALEVIHRRREALTIGVEYERSGHKIKIFNPMGYLAAVDYLSVSPSTPATTE